MIQAFIDRFMAKKDELAAVFSEKHPEDYSDVVRAVVAVLHDHNERSIDPGRIHEIDDGDYQGTLVFVIADNSYQPDEYWYVKVSYGSCSGCDTLEGISEGSREKPTEQQVADYLTLALHVVQGLRKMVD